MLKNIRTAFSQFFLYCVPSPSRVIDFLLPGYLEKKEFEKNLKVLCNFIKNPNLETQQTACTAVCNIQCQKIPENKKRSTIESLMIFIDMTSVLFRSGLWKSSCPSVAIGAAVRKILLNVSEDEIAFYCNKISSYENEKTKDVINLEMCKIIRQVFMVDASPKNDFQLQVQIQLQVQNTLLSEKLLEIFQSISVEKIVQVNLVNLAEVEDHHVPYAAIALNALLAWTYFDHTEKKIGNFESKQSFFEMFFKTYPKWFCKLFVRRIQREAIVYCKDTIEKEGFNNVNINLFNKLIYLNTIVAIYNEQNNEN